MRRLAAALLLQRQRADRFHDSTTEDFWREKHVLLLPRLVSAVFSLVRASFFFFREEEEEKEEEERYR